MAKITKYSCKIETVLKYTQQSTLLYMFFPI